MPYKVSVVIPFYNGREYLQECVVSVQNQTLREIEILLVDDGSTDGSGALADSMAAEDERIRVLHQSNQGLSGARNTGIDVAQGDYLGFVDADDVIAPDMYQKLYDTAVSLSSEVVTCAYRSFRESGVTESRLPNFPLQKRLAPEEIREMMPQLNMDGSLTFVWRRLYAAALFREKGIRFDTRFRICEDATFGMECLLRADGVAAIPDCLYFYRYVDSSLIRNKRYNPNMTDALLLQYSVKKALGETYMPTQNEALLRAMAEYTYRHIALLIFGNLYRNTGRGTYKEFLKAVRAPIIREMYRYMDVNAYRSKSLDWVMFKCIRLRCNAAAFCIGRYVFGKDKNNE